MQLFINYLQTQRQNSDRMREYLIPQVHLRVRLKNKGGASVKGALPSFAFMTLLNREHGYIDIANCLTWKGGRTCILNQNYEPTTH